MIKEKDSIATRGIIPLIIFALTGAILYLFLILDIMEKEKKEEIHSIGTATKETPAADLTVKLNIDNIDIECKDLDSKLSKISIDETSIIAHCLNGKEIVYRVEYLGINKDTKWKYLVVIK